MTDWFVGQKIVCIDDHFSFLQKRYFSLPKKDMVYSIREIDLDCEEVGFHLNEIFNEKFPFLEGLDEPYFLSTRFKPVVDTKLVDFYEILEKVNNSEEIEELV